LRIFPVGSVCMLCGETYPSRDLYKCQYCNGVYCGNCILLEDGGRIVCLRCAVRRVFPKAQGSKYANLSVLLVRRAGFRREITLSFAEIEDAIGDRLPKSAYENRGWWSNIGGSSHSEAWLTVGWRVKEVNLEDKTVTFIRENASATNIGKEAEKRVKVKSKGSSTNVDFKSLAVRAKISLMKKRKPSKTKIAILQARLKNLERAKRMRRNKSFMSF